mgnify:CR=1 FL=1|tara:strand:+ start:8540 stop:9451 length:912 start_codon:yes stop_codon:yes gene_type:complete
MKKNKRLISKIDFKTDNLIKGIEYDGLRSLGSVKNFVNKYYEEGLDEIILQDCVASLFGLEPKYDQIKLFTKDIFIPVTVGGGIKNIEQIKKIFNSGADKVAINTGAIQDPDLIYQAAKEFGSQSVVVSLEIFKEIVDQNDIEEKSFINLYFKNGKEKTNLKLKEWIKKIENNGAGEILANIVNRDGTGEGPDIDIVNKIKEITSLPVIYSGGIGNYNDIYKLFKETQVDAVSVSSLFHFHYYKSLIKLKNKISKDLRYGKNDDYGNYDYVLDGYGGIELYKTEKESIKKIKSKLIKDKIIVK